MPRPGCLLLTSWCLLAILSGCLLAAPSSGTISTPSTPGQRPVVDATTLDRKLLMGYQGWFACPGDGSPLNSWFHWFQSATPDAASANFDLWPDTSELDVAEWCPTHFTRPDGSPAPLYSAYQRQTVLRHFQWMKDYDLDGIMLQRFSSELSTPALFSFRNQVTENVRAGAEALGRVFAIMYDISGHNPSTLVADLKRDWTYLVDVLRITESPRYLRHRGKPVLAIWGLGFTDRPGTPAQARELIAYFQRDAAPQYRVTLIGGVPTHWRTLTGDSQSDPAWAAVYRSFDIISPWSVGRYGDEAGANDFQRNQIVPDLAEARAQGPEYMPVVFPGFSWHNLTGGPLNQIPRNGGRFYWRQVYNALSAGAAMIYGAMFDEVDEGTAMYKLAPTPAELPAQGTFLPLNIDGYVLPSDWYLRLAGQAGKMLRGDIALYTAIPITP
ncbi:MAG: xylosidase/arabinosidase [Deinococcus sp.]|nr:xylosidase/arabinosidase [Deinococcus sp.]